MADDELASLVRRAGAGDRIAADELVRRFSDPVRRDVHRRLAPDVRAREDTEDVLQATLLEAVGRLANFEYRGESSFRAWLAALAESRVLMAGRFHRQGMRDPRREETPSPGTGGPPGAGTSPSVAAVRGETTRRLREAVDTLPPDERRVVELHSFQGLGFREVAELSGLADKEAARYVFQKALKRMGEILDGPD